MMDYIYICLSSQIAIPISAKCAWNLGKLLLGRIDYPPPPTVSDTLYLQI